MIDRTRSFIARVHPTLLLAFAATLVPLPAVGAQAVMSGHSAITAVPQRSAAALAADTRVIWLRANAHPVRSVNSSDNDFADLEPLRLAIGNARVVMLGEQTHGDGTTFLAKDRLIRLLHEKMGFDVLAFESGFYDVAKSWERIRQGEDAAVAVRRSVFSIWNVLAEVQPLITYIGDEARGPHPLELAGVDDQLTGTATVDYLADDLAAFLREMGVDARLLAAGSSFRAQLEGMSGFGPAGGFPAPGAAFLDSLSRIRKDVASHLSAKPDSKAQFWTQALESFAADAHDMNDGIGLQMLSDSLEKHLREPTHGDSVRLNAGTSARDRQMGRNLVWLASRRYPTKKIIVWAASSHFVYDSTYYRPVKEGSAWDNNFSLSRPTMGWAAQQALGANAVYHLAFIANAGVAGSPNWSGPPHPVGHTPSSVELEDLLHATGRRFAFLDLRNLTSGGGWLNDSLYSRPMGNSPTRLQWPKTVDGFFFIDTTRSATADPLAILAGLQTSLRMAGRNNDLPAEAVDSLTDLLRRAQSSFEAKKLVATIALLHELDERVTTAASGRASAAALQRRVHSRVMIMVEALHAS